MASAKLSIQDKKDLHKFMKFFALKYTQIIVQSRLGEKAHTKCKPLSSGSDWFNLSIKDLPEVTAETKKALCEDILTSRFPLCVEISLKTVDGDSMLLETWLLRVYPDKLEFPIRPISMVYNSMGVLIKSLLSSTRATPAYKLSRRQGSDSYVICYRIFMGTPLLQNLGEDAKKDKIGQISTPLGRMRITAFHRTKLTISPQHTGRQNSIMLKSDHFNKDLSPKHKKIEIKEEVVDLNKPLIVPFADETRIKSKPFIDLISDVPPELEILYELAHRPLKGKGEKKRPIELDHGNITPPSLPEIKIEEKLSLSSSLMTIPDEVIMIRLNLPFATIGDTGRKEVSSLIRECQSAPPLQTFSEELTLADQAPAIEQTIKDLENIHIPEFNEMINSLCNPENNSEDSS